MGPARSLPLVAAAFLASGCVVTNPSPPAPAGTVVRVSEYPTPPAPTELPRVFQGTLIYLDADTLLLHDSQSWKHVAVPVTRIAKLEVWRGRRPTAGSVAKGVGIGALTGALAGALAGAAAEAIFGGLDGDHDIGEAAARGGVEGAIQGGIAGGVVGAAIGSTVWQEVTVLQLRQELCNCRISEPTVASTPPSGNHAVLGHLP